MCRDSTRLASEPHNILPRAHSLARSAPIPEICYERAARTFQSSSLPLVCRLDVYAARCSLCFAVRRRPALLAVHTRTACVSARQWQRQRRRSQPFQAQGMAWWYQIARRGRGSLTHSAPTHKKTRPRESPAAAPSARDANLSRLWTPRASCGEAPLRKDAQVLSIRSQVVNNNISRVRFFRALRAPLLEVVRQLDICGGGGGYGLSMGSARSH